MYKTRFFKAGNVEALQEEVNDWLAREKDLFVVSTNMTSLASAAGDQHVFYIFYEVLGKQQEQMQEIISDQKSDVDPLSKIDLNLL